jgi:Aspartyl protease
MKTFTRQPLQSIRSCLAAGLLLSQAAGAASLGSTGSIEPPSSATAAAQNALAARPPDESQVLTEVVVHATDPRYVLPTRRDRIGRIWAPVYLNGRGPYRLVLDTGANHSGITAGVAESLGLSLDASQPVMLRGVTGSASVPTVRVDTLVAGVLREEDERLPIVTDALGGADGVLGTDNMQNRRIHIDFAHDAIDITRSRNEVAPPGFHVVPFETLRGNLLVVSAMVGKVRTKAIIDTGGQTTIANSALRQALARSDLEARPLQIEGVTTDMQMADAMATPPLRLIGTDRPGSSLEFRYRDVSYGDMHIFEHWRLIDEPAMLVGMDALGLVDTLIIDYRRHELQIRVHSND